MNQESNVEESGELDRAGQKRDTTNLWKVESVCSSGEVEMNVVENKDGLSERPTLPIYSCSMNGLLLAKTDS